MTLLKSASAIRAVYFLVHKKWCSCCVHKQNWTHGTLIICGFKRHSDTSRAQCAMKRRYLKTMCEVRAHISIRVCLFALLCSRSDAKGQRESIPPPPPQKKKDRERERERGGREFFFYLFIYKYCRPYSGPSRSGYINVSDNIKHNIKNEIQGFKFTNILNTNKERR